ncbi:MAG: glycosyltransferase family 2 protein [Clostridia bacterium]|nr:glycosyltransferase family 2 protein [Clostridia bacterium]
MSTPCISVIVPVYNAEKYLRECIESILNQTFRDLELILVDDGSPDNCCKICDEYAEKDNRVIVFHQENRGVSAARNLGIDNAQGEYITFVDSDDYIMPYALELLYHDSIFSNADISCVSGRKKCSNTIEALEKSKYVIWRGSDSVKKSLLDNGALYSSCRKLYKKEFLGDTRFEEGKKIHEDSFFVFCCCLKKPVFVLRNAYIYHYRNNPDSASHAPFSDKFLDILYFANQKQELINKYFPELQAEANNMVVKANLSMLNLFCRTNDKKYKKDIKQCIKTVKKLKKYFVPVIPIDKKMFLIVVNNLYGFFRIYYKLKYKRK